MPTLAEKNAAYDAVKAKITELEHTMPGMFVGYVESYLTVARVVDMVNAALVAAEGVRAKP
jgi:hypothetical protein